MKQAEILRCGSKYDFDLRVDDMYVGMAFQYHTTKEDCIRVIKDHFPEFEIVDKTEES